MKYKYGFLRIPVCCIISQTVPALQIRILLLASQYNAGAKQTWKVETTSSQFSNK
jgi:hypothetical protein